MSVEDTALVRRCLDGHTDAMRQLIERFQSDVFGLSFRLLTQRQDAEDVTQEVFLRVFRSLRRWDTTRALKPWIMGITVNRCRTWLSARIRRPELIDYLQETAARDDSDDSTEMVLEIQSALLQLRADYRAVFVMFHEQGLSYEEIAESMERPAGTVKTWLHRARLEVLDHLRRRGMLPDAELIPKLPIRPPTP